MNLDHVDSAVGGKKGLYHLYGKVGVNLANKRNGRGSRIGLVGVISKNGPPGGQQ